MRAPARHPGRRRLRRCRSIVSTCARSSRIWRTEQASRRMPTRLSKGSPSTAATASRTFSCRATAARLGRARNSVRISESIRSANGRSHCACRPEHTICACARSIASVNRNRWSRYGMRQAICAMSWKQCAFAPREGAMIKIGSAVIVGALWGLASLAIAEPVTYDLPEETAVLKPGPGLDTAQNNCVACHSADYIAIQPPKRGKAFWDAEVTKMIKTYGAPIPEADAKVIADYLPQSF